MATSPQIVVKPKIAELLCAISRYGIACANAGYSPISWRMARATLRQELEVFGVVELFDWTED